MEWRTPYNKNTPAAEAELVAESEAEQNITGEKTKIQSLQSSQLP